MCKRQIFLASLAFMVGMSMGLSLTHGQDGLVGYWKFDEASGTTAADVAGGDNDGTLIGDDLVWSAGKFGGELVGKAVLESGIAEKIKHRRIIIPGYVAVIKGEMEDALPGWEVMVGPQEASDIPSYVKEVWLPLQK